MIAVFKDGSVVYNIELANKMEGSYVLVEKLPDPHTPDGKVALIDGYDENTHEILIKYIDDITNSEEPIVEYVTKDSEPLTQLDRIEMAISKSNDELRQEGIDAFTLELINNGIL